MRRSLRVGLAVAVLGAAAIGLTRRGDAPIGRHAGPSRVTASATGDEMAGGTTSGAALPPDPSARRPRSLRGTRTDGGLVVDADGRFVPTLEARRLFDYFLTTEGELPLDALRARIVRAIERRLSPDAARDATALLDRYLAYRDAVRLRATAAAPGGDDLDGRLATLAALRREMLGEAAATAFFAGEEAEARLLLETRRILADPTLAAEERAARVEVLYAAREADLPADVRAARATARLASALRIAEAEVRARGGDAAELQALRERLAGPEAATRLADLDRRRAGWDARVEAFRGARERLDQDPSLSPDARTAAIARLLAESFTPPERLRVAALDRLAATRPAAR
jgi:lipase chaperone LimK